MDTVRVWLVLVEVVEEEVVVVVVRRSAAVDWCGAFLDTVAVVDTERCEDGFNDVAVPPSRWW